MLQFIFCAYSELSWMSGCYLMRMSESSFCILWIVYTVHVLCNIVVLDKFLTCNISNFTSLHHCSINISNATPTSKCICVEIYTKTCIGYINISPTIWLRINFWVLFYHVFTPEGQYSGIRIPQQFFYLINIMKENLFSKIHLKENVKSKEER